MPRFFIDTDIAKAKTIDTAYYTSPVYYEESKEKIFAQSWQLVGDKDKVQEPGSAYPFTLLEGYLNEPLLITNDKEITLALHEQCMYAPRQPGGV